MKKITVLLLSLSLHAAYAQKREILPLTADSLATGNYKDVLTGFFQLGFERLTGPNKELKFSSNPFAVMAKLDNDLLLSNNYYRYRKLRNLNFAAALKLDNDYKFNGFSSAVKYALINQRDETVSWAFVSMVLGDEKIQAFFQLNNHIISNISTLAQDRELQKKLLDEANLFMQGKLKFNKLDEKLQTAIKQFLAAKQLVEITEIIDNDKNFNPAKLSADIYDNYKETINNKLLWTISLSDTTYKDQFMFSNMVLSTDLVKGIDKTKRADVELNIHANLQYVDDTLRTERDLNRSIFAIEPGLNFVAKTKNGLKSFLEFKLSGGFYYTLSGAFIGEEKNRITLNGTLRMRVYNDIWIPVEIRYDPKTGNVFGILNVRTNFTALKSFLKG